MNSFYHVLSADAYTKHGYNIHGCIFDELHAQPNRELWDVLTEGTGDTRTQPLIFAITTAGYDRNSICWEVHEYARKVKEGIIEDPHFLPVMYGLPEEEDWRDEKNWKKVNPSLGHTFTIDKLRAAYKECEHIPAKQNLFRRLRLDQWTRQETRFIPMDFWESLDPLNRWGGNWDFIDSCHFERVKI
jgi:phage terminase large subunit-like protein